MKKHEHKYIQGQIGEECEVCGLLKSTIEDIETPKSICEFCEGDYSKCNGYHPRTPKKIEKLPTPATGFTQERINSETQDKINEIIEWINSKKDQLL